MKLEGFIELQNWLGKRFDMAIRFTATDGCPICYLKAHPQAAYGEFEHPNPVKVGFVWHVPGLSRWAYNTCYDPTRKMLQFYDVWFNLTLLRAIRYSRARGPTRAQLQEWQP